MEDRYIEKLISCIRRPSPSLQTVPERRLPGTVVNERSHKGLSRRTDPCARTLQQSAMRTLSAIFGSQGAGAHRIRRDVNIANSSDHAASVQDPKLVEQLRNLGATGRGMQRFDIRFQLSDAPSLLERGDSTEAGQGRQSELEPTGHLAVRRRGAQGDATALCVANPS